MTHPFDELIMKVESYRFSCEAGPLEKCVNWQELKRSLDELSTARVSLTLPPMPKLMDYKHFDSDVVHTAAYNNALAAWERVCATITRHQLKETP